MRKDFSELSIPGEIEFSTVELKKGEEFEITGNKIITVVSGKVYDREKGALSTFESSVYHSGKIIAEVDTLLSIFDVSDLNIILNKVDVDEKFGPFCRKNWDQLRELWDVEGFEKFDQYRSEKINYIFNGTKYSFNLWFSGKEVSGRWHNKHSFIELHTNIVGVGFMQKSFDENGERLIETVGLLPGNSHRIFNIDGEFEKNGDPIYPTHRWLAGKTGSIWLAIEKYV